MPDNEFNRVEEQLVSVAPPEERRSWLWGGLAVVLIALLVALALFFYVQQQNETPTSELAPQEPVGDQRVKLEDGERVFVDEQTDDESAPVYSAETDPSEVTTTQRSLRALPGESAPTGMYEIGGSVTEVRPAENFIRVYDRNQGSVYTAFLSEVPIQAADISVGVLVRVITADDPATEFDVTATEVHVAEPGSGGPTGIPF